MLNTTRPPTIIAMEVVGRPFQQVQSEFTVIDHIRASSFCCDEVDLGEIVTSLEQELDTVMKRAEQEKKSAEQELERAEQEKKRAEQELERAEQERNAILSQCNNLKKSISQLKSKLTQSAKETTEIFNTPFTCPNCNHKESIVGNVNNLL